jgi:UDP-glucose 4-epimerase
MSTEEGKSVLLVGAGFLGKHFLQDWLVSKPDAKIIVLDKVDSDTFYGHEITKPYASSGMIKYLWGNSGDPEQLEPLFKDGQIDDIVYTAAIDDVPYAEKNPRDTYRINVENTHMFMEYLAKMDFKGRTVLMSSESVYKKKPCLPVENYPSESIAFKETDELGPHSVYGDSKMKQEQAAMEVARENGLRLVVLRSATMYGYFARPKQIISIYINQLLTDQNMTMMGTGTETSRDFINVLDTVKAINSMLNADKSIDGEIFNIGTGRETFMLNLANAMKEIVGQPSEPYDKKTGAPRPGFKPFTKIPQREGEKGARIVLDITKAKQKLKMIDNRGQEGPWEPEINLIDGLKNTIYWTASRIGYDEKELEHINKVLFPEKFIGKTSSTSAN